MKSSQPLSARCWISPSLRLHVGNSTIRGVLHAALSLCAVYSLYRLSLRGYPLLSLALLPALALACRQLARQPLQGAALCWQRGEWTIEHAGNVTRIALRRCSVSLPWLIFLAWTELPGGRHRSLWLYPDSAAVPELRGLRVRLTLEW